MIDIRVGDALTELRKMPDESVQMCCTSPPYWGLRDYQVAGQLGLERTPGEYVERMVEVFREVRRVLRKDGTLWLNIGDSYCAAPNSNLHANSSTLTSRSDGTRKGDAVRIGVAGNKGNRASGMAKAPHRMRLAGYKAKDLIGIPWMLAFALRSDGWYLRAPIIWAKPNGMPGSQKDRPTLNYEMLFLLSKSRTYYYDHMAVRTPLPPSSIARLSQPDDGRAKTNGAMKAVKFGGNKRMGGSGGGGLRRLHERERKKSSVRTALTAGTSGGGFDSEGAMLRSVWWISTEPNKEAHFAIMPKELARRCILLGSKAGDVILDPFLGAGTTGLVADRHGRAFIGVDLNSAYAEMARRRIHDDAPLFSDPEGTAA